ncbi:MAG: BamA/TamA family outer membrane protein [Elusimicrobia bacterium]|nr:BamA/TamA family outer membrane protein [Elusimicrobiota bacterium]
MRRALLLSFLLLPAAAALAADQPGPPAAQQPAQKPAKAPAKKPARSKRKRRVPVHVRNPLQMPPGRSRPPTSPSSEFEVVAPTSIPVAMEQPGKQPWPIRLMIHPLKQGMFIGLPVIDTDPNRGITYGIMPILVVQKADNDRITSIWAPSVTYNKTFRTNGTLRYYAYPTRESDLTLRGAWAQVNDREAMGEYRDRNVWEKGYDLGAKVQYNIDGSNRFFGVGPNTSVKSESNYTNDTLNFRALIGLPLGKDSGWMVKAIPLVSGTNISNGPINTIPQISNAFPGRETHQRHQNSNVRVSLDFDSRDQDVTTTQGTYFGLAVDNSVPALASEYAYQDYSVDVRHFHPWGGPGKQVSAFDVRFDQLQGTAPFWLMPQLGGKYVHRAYGDGRYIDKGLFSAQAEQRYTFYSAVMSGVTTDFEVAPFAGVGTVFDTPGQMACRYLRPVVGGAVRAIARPQVVGSIDFGVGQEGLAAFMDINYSW